MSKVLLPCPNDSSRILDPKSGRCFMPNNIVIKNLLKEGYTILVTSNQEQPEPNKKYDDIKVFKVCPEDPSRVINPITGRCVLISNVDIKRLLKEGWSLALRDDRTAPVIVKADTVSYPKLVKELDKNKDSIVSINEYLDSREITKPEETEKMGMFQKVTTSLNILNYLFIKAKTDPVISKNVCIFDNQIFFERGLKTPERGLGEIRYFNTFPEFLRYDSLPDTEKKYKISGLDNKAILFSSPRRNTFTRPTLLITPKIGLYLNNCKERFLIMPLSLYSISVDQPFTETSMGHANVLIFDTFLKTIERFDPHGTQSYEGANVSYNQDAIDKYLTGAFGSLLPSYKYIEFSVACPYFGPQLYVERNTSKVGGYCVMWSLMFIILKLLNPNKSSIELLKFMTKGTPDEIANKLSRFTKSVVDTLKKTNKI